MTVAPAAGASPAPRQGAHPPARTGEAASGGFRELLEGRRALTDPDAGPDGRAPLAVSFDQGDLFGTAVALRHDRAHSGSGPEVQAEGQRSQPATHPGARPPASVAAEPVIAGVGSGEAIQPTADQAAAGPTVLARSPAAGLEAASERHTDTPMPQGAGPHGGNPALPAGKARDVAEASRPRSVEARAEASWPRGVEARAEAGIARRRQAAAQLAPVNVVARATQAGVEIAVRIGHRLDEDDEALEGAVRRAVEADGEALDGLRIDGREIEGSRRCR